MGMIGIEQLAGLQKKKSAVYYSRSRLYILWAYFGVAYIGQDPGFFGLEKDYWVIDLAWCCIRKVWMKVGGIKENATGGMGIGDQIKVGGSQTLGCGTARFAHHKQED